MDLGTVPTGLRANSSATGFGTLFSKKPDSNYLSLLWVCGFSYNYSTLPVCAKAAMDDAR